MSHTSFQNSLRAYQQSRGTIIHPSSTSSYSSSDPNINTSWTINPQRWINSMRSSTMVSTGTVDDQDEGRGLLSGLLGNNTTHESSSSSSSTSPIVTRTCNILCSCCPNLSTTQRFTVFACCTGGGILFLFLSFFMLPMVVLAPQKFAFLSCMGSLLLFASLGFLRGWPGHMSSVFSKGRWPFSLGYLLSLIGGLWASVIIHNYILTVIFILLHTISLIWYYVSFLPGGISGLRAMSGMMASSGRSILPV